LVVATGDDAWSSFEVALISGGKSNLTFELSSEAGVVILRRPPTGDLMASAHDMSREVRVQEALAGTVVPVPRVIMFQADSDMIGAPFYVMERVPGHVIRDELPEGYADSPDEKVALSNALVDVLADLHALQPEHVGLGDFGRPDGYLERQLRRWQRQWDVNKTHDVASVDALGRLLDEALPTSTRSSIVHGDYRLDNCLVSLESPSRVNAVLDWELSTLGDPLSDLGLLMFYWREPDEYVPVLIPSITRNPGFPRRSSLAQRYEERTGARIENISFYEAFAHFKFAVIVQGIIARVATDAMAGQEFGDLNEEVKMIAEEGVLRMKE
jgi:aminoglycoside phosphotransferase (APT) family kinase protein